MRSWLFMPAALCGLMVLHGGVSIGATTPTKTGAEEKKGRVSAVQAPDPKIVEKVRAIAAEILGVKASAVDVDVPLSKQKAAADELDLVEIVMALEEKFGIEIADADLGGTPAQFTATTSVRKLAGIVAKKKKH
jgi:acyl carrier protein